MTYTKGINGMVVALSNKTNKSLFAIQHFNTCINKVTLSPV